MSGAHFGVECQPGACRIRDLDSANGTFVNGSRVQESELHESDVIRAGRTSLVAHFEGAVAEAEPIPDYLKGIVPPGIRTIDYGPAPAEVVPAPPQSGIIRTEVELARIQESLAAEATYRFELPRPDVQPPPPSYLPSLPPPVVPLPASDLSTSLSGIASLAIEAVAGPHAGARLSLRWGDAFSVGRGDRADLVLARDSGLSSLHFAVRSISQGFEINDLGSTNGTLLNGQTVAAALLADGDEIRAGQSRFKVRLEGGAAVQASALPRGEAISLAEGVRDPDPRVRREALFAAAWTAQAWLLAHCRKLAENPTPKDWDAITLLALLGKPVELSRIEALSRADALGPRRPLLCGMFGHPAPIDRLLDGMAAPDPALAAVAGLAFSKLTGVDVASPQRVEIVLEEGGPPSDLSLPDVAKARTHWKQVQAKFADSTRICRGFDLSDIVSDEVLAELDMESRWEVRLRGHFYGTWQGKLKDADAPS